MKSATVAEAKEHLEELIAAVRAGEQVEITVDGEPVASLSAAVPADRPRKLRDLEDRGLLAPGRGGAKPTFPRLREPVHPSGALDALIEERRGGR